MVYEVKKDDKSFGEVNFDDSLLSLKDFKQGLHNLHNKLFGSYKGNLRFEKTKSNKILVFSSKGEFLMSLEPKKSWWRLR